MKSQALSFHLEFKKEPHEDYYYVRGDSGLDFLRHTPEEIIRQLMVVRLKQAGYPISRFRLEHPVRVGSAKCRADIAVLKENGEPYLIVEAKAGKAKSGLDQLKSYMAATEVPYGVAAGSDGELYLERRGFQDYREIGSVPIWPPSSETSVGRTPNKLAEKNAIAPKPTRPPSLLQQGLGFGGKKISANSTNKTDVDESKTRHSEEQLASFGMNEFIDHVSPFVFAFGCVGILIAVMVNLFASTTFGAVTGFILGGIGVVGLTGKSPISVTAWTFGISKRPVPELCAVFDLVIGIVFMVTGGLGHKF